MSIETGESWNEAREKIVENFMEGLITEMNNCEYCAMWQPSEYGGHVTRGEKDFDVECEDGVRRTDRFDMESYLVEYDDGIELYVCAESDKDRVLLNITIPIKHCPMCGRRL